MNHLLSQIMLARRGNDVENWMNILIVVIIAVVYGLSSMFKAKARKPQDQDEQEPSRPKPGSKLAEIAERFQRELSELTRDRAPEPPQRAERPQKDSSPQPRRPGRPVPARRYHTPVRSPGAEVPGRRAVDKLAAEAKEPSVFATIEPLTEPQLSLLRSQVQPAFGELPQLGAKIEGLPEFTSEAIKELGDKRPGIPVEVPESEHLSEILSDYADPDELRRAILHYEILGRPLSLRDPSSQIIGL